MDVHPQQATAADAPAIHALRRSLEDWMAARGIDQWPVGSVPAERIAAQVADGQWWVVRDDEGLLGSVRVVGTDPEYWGDDDAPALYVHGLMVDRRASGSGLGRALVEWAGERARAAGVTWLRLDHRASNPHLDDVYRSWGFEPVGVTDRPGFEVVLMQRPASSAPLQDAHGDDVRVPPDVAVEYVAGFESPPPDEGPLRVIRP